MVALALPQKLLGPDIHFDVESTPVVNLLEGFVVLLAGVILVAGNMAAQQGQW